MRRPAADAARRFVDDERLLEALFKGTNFGGPEATHVGRMMTVAQGVLQLAAGYATGSTVWRICRAAGLVTRSPKAGRRVLSAGHHFAMYAMDVAAQRCAQLRTKALEKTDGGRVYADD